MLSLTVCGFFARLSSSWSLCLIICVLCVSSRRDVSAGGDGQQGTEGHSRRLEEVRCLSGGLQYQQSHPTGRSEGLPAAVRADARCVAVDCRCCPYDLVVLLLVCGTLCAAACTSQRYCVWSSRRSFDLSVSVMPMCGCRPEIAESAYILYRVTGDRYWWNVGRDMITALQTNTRVAHGTRPVCFVGGGSVWLLRVCAR